MLELWHVFLISLLTLCLVKITANEKALAKCGLSKNFSSRKTNGSQKLFQWSKFTKKDEIEKLFADYFSSFSIRVFSPAFCQCPVVCSAISPFFVIFQRFFSVFLEYFHENWSKHRKFHFQNKIFRCFLKKKDSIILYSSFFRIDKHQNFFRLKIFRYNFSNSFFSIFCFQENIFPINFRQIFARIFSDFFKN